MNTFERWSLWISAAGTTVTGVGLLWVKYFLQSDDPWAVINHPLQPWLLKAHILAVPLLIFALGLVTARHIWAHYRAGVRDGRRSGSLTALVAIPMIATGYLVQTVTREDLLAVIAISHIVLGLAFAAGFVSHQAFVVRRRSRSAAPTGANRRSYEGIEGRSMVTPSGD
jgi:hypothetical protein